jgi:hypothetical protein
MEPSRGALDPNIAFIFEGNFPDKNRPDIPFFHGIKFSRSDLRRPRFHGIHLTKTLSRQDWPRVVVIFPAEIPPPARFGFHGSKPGRQGGQ